MTREEMRARAIEVMCRAANDTRDDPMCSQPKWEDFIEDMEAALDALSAAGFIVIWPKDDEMWRADAELPHNTPRRERFFAMLDAADLTRKL